jgi:hypothetical protein
MPVPFLSHTGQQRADDVYRSEEIRFKLVSYQGPRTYRLAQFLDCADEGFGTADEEDVDAGEGREDVGDGGLALAYIPTCECVRELRVRDDVAMLSWQSLAHLTSHQHPQA